jgi:hypothetical protein
VVTGIIYHSWQCLCADSKLSTTEAIPAIE